MNPPDLSSQLTSFARMLREAGVAVDTSRVIAAALALAEFQPLGPAEIYWATRLTFCSGRPDLELFDAAFRGWLGAELPPPDRYDRGVTAGSAAQDVADDGTATGPAGADGAFV